MTDKLLPCPFCGRRVQPPSHTPADRWTITCHCCSTKVSGYYTEEGVVFGWNSRTRFSWPLRQEPPEWNKRVGEDAKPAPAPLPPPPAYEYRAHYINPTYPSKDLNLLSKQGWTLVAVDNSIAYLSRPVSPKE